MALSSLEKALVSVVTTGFSMPHDPTRSIATMMDNTRSGVPKLKPLGETGATLLAVGGFATAFGAASCCVLPMLLASLGLGSAWLSNLALLAAPHRLVLAAAVVCLVGGGGMVLWGRRAAIACAPGAACGRSVVTGLIMRVLSLGVVLTVLGYVFA
jgi:mercuric ion transport protein